MTSNQINSSSPIGNSSRGDSAAGFFSIPSLESDAASLKGKEILTEAPAAQDQGGGILNWMTRKVTDAAKWTANSAVGAIVDFKVDVEAQDKAQEESLKNLGLVGKDSNTDALDAFVLLRERLHSVLMDLIRKNLPEEDNAGLLGQGGLYLFQQREKQIHDLIGVMTGSILTNIAKETYGKLPENDRSPDKFVAAIIEQFIVLNRTIITDDVSSSEEKAFEAAQEYLKLGFPNGAVDLPVSRVVRHQVWGFAARAIASVLPEWNRMIMAPERSPRMVGKAFELNQFEQSGQLNSVLKALVANQAPGLANKLFTDKTRDKVAVKATELLSKEPQVKVWLQPYIKKQLDAIIDPNQAELWKFVFNTLEGTISHLLGSVAVNHLNTDDWMFGREAENFLAALVEALFKEGAAIAASIDSKEFARISKLREGELKKVAIQELMQPAVKKLADAVKLQELPYYKLLQKKNDTGVSNVLEDLVIPQILYVLYKELNEGNAQHEAHVQQLNDFIKSQMTDRPQSEVDQETAELMQALESVLGLGAHKLEITVRKSLVKELHGTADSVAKTLVRQFHIHLSADEKEALTQSIAANNLEAVKKLIETKVKAESKKPDYVLTREEAENLSIIVARSKVEAKNKKLEGQYEQIALRFGLTDFDPAAKRKIKEAINDADYDGLERQIARHRQVSLSPKEQNDLSEIVDGKIISEINKLLFKNALNPSDRRFLRSALNQILASEEPGAKQVWKYLEGMVTNSALKALCEVTQSGFALKAKQDAADGQGNVLSNFVGEWAGFLSQQMQEIYPKVETILRTAEAKLRANEANFMDEKRVEMSLAALFDPEGSFAGVSDETLRREFNTELSLPALAAANRKEIEALFHDFTAQVLAQLLPQGANSLPVPAFVREKVYGIFKEKLNSYIAQSYLESIPWVYDKQKNIDELKAAYGSDHLRWTSIVIKRFVGDFIPHILSADNTKIAGAVVKGAITVAEKENVAPLKDYMAKHGEKAAGFVAKTVDGLIANPGFQEALNGVEELTDTALLQLMNNLTKKIQAHEAANPDFLTDLMTDLMGIAATHMETVHAIAEYSSKVSKKTQNAQDVRPHVMHYSYNTTHEFISESRHASVPPPEATEDQKKAIRMKNLIAPLCEKLMTVAGVASPDDLPVPKASRKLAYKLLKKKLIPEIIHQIYKQVIDPHTLNTIVLTTLEALEKNLDNFGKNSSKEPQQQKPALPAYPQQSGLNSACAKLVGEVVKFAPLSMTKVLFKNAKVRGMVGSTVGNVLRNQLFGKSLLDLIKAGVKPGMTHHDFSPGKWVVENGVEVLKPYRVVHIEEDGTRITEPAPGGETFKFFFPKTPEENAASDLQKSKDVARVEEKLKAKAGVVANKAARIALKATINRCWNGIQKFLDRIFSKIKMTPVKKVLDKICRFLFITLLKPVLSFLFWPFKKLIWLIVGHYLKGKMEEFDPVKLLKMPTHENIAAKGLEAIVEKLSKDTPPPLEPVKDGEDPIEKDLPLETPPAEVAAH